MKISGEAVSGDSAFLCKALRMRGGGSGGWRRTGHLACGHGMRIQGSALGVSDDGVPRATRVRWSGNRSQRMAVAFRTQRKGDQRKAPGRAALQSASVSRKQRA